MDGGHEMTQDEIKQSFAALLQKPEFADKNSELASVIIDWMIVGAMHIQPIIIREAYEWLKKNIDNYYHSSCQADDCYFDSEQMLGDFRKAMEE